MNKRAQAKLYTEYKCYGCERTTRTCGHDADNTLASGKDGTVGVCTHCYEMFGIENEFSDCTVLKYPTERMMRDWTHEFSVCQKLGGNPSQLFKLKFRPIPNTPLYQIAGELRDVCVGILNREYQGKLLSSDEYYKLLKSVETTYNFTIIGLNEMEKKGSERPE